MTKTKLKQIIVDQIQLFLEENKEDIIDGIVNDTYDVDENGDTVQVEQDVVEEVYEDIVGDLF